MKKELVFMPHPGHFICARDCEFFLNTYVNGFIISTVGELFPDAPVREIYAESRGIKLEGMGDARRADYRKKVGYEELGYERKYETMVFLAQKSEHKCCPWRIVSGRDLEMEGYNDPGEAYRGHMKFCKKYSKKVTPRQSIIKSSKCNNARKKKVRNGVQS